MIKNQILQKKDNNYNENTSWIGVTLTYEAEKQILYLIKKNPEMLGLKINIKKSGCAGFTYIINKATSVNKNDFIYERNGAKLFISSKIMPFIDGTKLDYVQEGLNNMFKFHNPKARYLCGCGESFGITK